MIRPLAEEERLTNGRLQGAMLRGRKFVLDLRAISRTVRDLSDRKLLAIRNIRDLRAARHFVAEIPAGYPSQSVRAVSRIQRRTRPIRTLYQRSGKAAPSSA